jgi:hypothetical protein
MSLISTQREDAISILSQEAKFLVQMGPKHPEHAQKIGRLIVAYQRLITLMKQQALPQQSATVGTELPSHH